MLRTFLTGAEEILEDLDVLNQQGDIEWDRFKFEHLAYYLESPEANSRVHAYWKD